ncbi:thioredoxin H2-like [Magnolia sinica]|uniref:thioredoxin H2-like n=1 Tax=Magnolia sinica TaxID=86752 RepID=UPI0026591F49|nr:thioredoxin H2-like [Magnolia sinica]
MGVFFSSSNSNDGSSSEPSRVLAFHSADTWKSHLESSKDSNQLMVIDFTAKWCGPCRFMEPIMNEMANSFTDVVFVKIDVDELKEVAQVWQVEAMPTFVLVKKGQEVDRLVGANKDELKKKIEKYSGSD